MLKDACEQVHFEYSDTHLETPASNGRGENSIRAMKEMVQRQKDAVFSLGIEFSIKHPLFALLVRHSEWILNNLVRVEINWVFQPCTSRLWFGVVSLSCVVR